MSFTTPDKAKTYLRAHLQGARMFKALEAMDICLEYHNGMRRDGVTPEWFHQFSIVLYLTTLEPWFSQVVPGAAAEDIYCIAFLHDVVEDYKYPLETIRTKFGSNIANAVELISKENTGTGFKKTNEDYYAAMGNNPYAAIVKGADRMHNFQSMPGVFTPEKQDRYISEAKNLILPMLKAARKKYPSWRPAFENIKHALSMQMTLISNTLEGRK